MPDYQKDIASAVVDANNPEHRYLKHLAPYAGTGKLYLGESGVAYQHRINGSSTPMSLDDKAGTATGAEILANWREFAKNNPTYGTDANAYNFFGEATNPTADADRAYQHIRNMYGNVELDADKLYYTQQELKGLAEVAEQMGEPKRNGKLLLPWAINEDVPTGGYKVIGFREAQQPLDNSKLVGMEQIRPGELDNAIAGLKEQLGGAFNEAWDKQYAPKLGNLTPEKRQQVRDKAEKHFWDNVDWSKYIKYDPLFGMYAPLGSVKHVNDRGSRWDDYALPVMTALASAVTGGTAGAALGEMAGAAASSAVGGSTAGAAAGTTAGATTGAAAGTAGGAAAGTTAAATAAGTIAGGATQGLVGSLIGSAMTGNRVTGKNLATSMLMGGLTPYANANLGQYITRPGTTALLEAIRQAATNKGKVDPRLVLATVAGSEAAGWVGGQLKNSGIVGKFLGGVTGGVVKQGINGGQMDAAGMALSGVGNTGTAGATMARLMRTYQGQQALRQYMAQRQRG